MLPRLLPYLWLLASTLQAIAHNLSPEERPRLVVLTDMANEPDDAESLVRLLLYSNEIDIEGLIATTSTWLRHSTHEEQIHNVLTGFRQALPSLQAHTPASLPYPSFEHLTSVTSSTLPVFGMLGVGKGRDSAGSKLLVDAIDRVDARGRKVFVNLWGGAAGLAQALWHVRETRSTYELEAFIDRIAVVYAISDQDDAGPWIRRNFPKVPYIASVHGENQYAVAAWTGVSGDLFYGFKGGDQSLISMEWVRKNIQLGPLGSLYPDFDFIMEGDTPAFLSLIPNGLNFPSDPAFGGWGGRYTRLHDEGSAHYADSVDRAVSPVDGSLVISSQATIWRWREDVQLDFAARIQWTLSDDYVKANHPPTVIVNGDSMSWAPIRATGRPGETLVFDASASSDPDAGDALMFRWIQYKEIGSKDHRVDYEVPTFEMNGTATSSKLSVTVPPEGIITFNHHYPDRRDFHFILKVTDSGTPALTRYRRVIITVHNKEDSRPARRDEL